MQYRDLAADVTRRLVAQIEAGTGPWRMPWHTHPHLLATRNAATALPYRGGNIFTLAVARLERDYPSGWWATYKQWAQLDAQVRRAERAVHIVKWVPARTADVDTSDDEHRGRLVPRVYAVFNAAQVDGWTAPAAPPLSVPERDDRVDRWIAATGASISYRHDHACYRPGVDRVELPELCQFADAEAFYATTCHELVHWSGHPSRLNRDLTGRFGDHAYAAEELVAELGAAIACAQLDVMASPRDDHAAYLAHWLQILNEEPTALFTVAAKAQAAVDHLDSLQPDQAAT